MISSNDKSKRSRSLSKTKRRFVSIYQAIEDKAGVSEEEVYSPKDNIITAQYTVERLRDFVDGLTQSFIDKEERIASAKAEGKTSEESFSPAELGALRNAWDALRAAEGEVIRLKKVATETSALIQSRFDAAQVWAIVKQLPSIVSQDLDGFLFEIVRELRELNDSLPKEMRLDHPLLGKMGEIEVAKVSTTFADRLHHHIEAMTVPGNAESSQSDEEMTLGEVSEMLTTLISEKPSGYVEKE